MCVCVLSGLPFKLIFQSSHKIGNIQPSRDTSACAIDSIICGGIANWSGKGQALILDYILQKQKKQKRRGGMWNYSDKGKESGQNK